MLGYFRQVFKQDADWQKEQNKATTLLADGGRLPAGITNNHEFQ
jgi:hypothetical protein